MAEVGGGGFLGAIAGIGATVGTFLKQFFGITAREFVRLITALKNALVDVTQALVTGVVQLGKNLWKAVAALGRLTGLGVKRFLLWADKKFRVLEKWLKDRFAPVLKFLKTLKDHINEFYKKFVRPIIDTIEFIRSFNRILQLFHINLLGRLDSVLARVEQRLDEPFLWVQRHITELQNWIDRIVTFDGVLKRLTLLRSMVTHERDVWKVWWASVHNRETERVRVPPGDVAERTAESAARELYELAVLDDQSTNALAHEHSETLRHYVLSSEWLAA